MDDEQVKAGEEEGALGEGAQGDEDLSSPPPPPSLSERDSVLASARIGRSKESREEEMALRLTKGQHAAALEALLRTPEWKVFETLATAEEESYEFQALDVSELMRGVRIQRVAGMDPTNPSVATPVASPVDGIAWLVSRTFYQGAAWGAHAILSFPQRFLAMYAREQTMRAERAKLVGPSGKLIRRRGTNRSPLRP